jgi:hypothetical protein
MKSYAPPLQGGLRRGHVAVGGDHDRLGLRLEGPGQLQHPQARLLVLHHQVGDHDVEAAVAELLFGGRKPPDDRADVAGLPKGVGHRLGVVEFIVDDQHLGAGRIVAAGAGVGRRA